MKKVSNILKDYSQLSKDILLEYLLKDKYKSESSWKTGHPSGLKFEKWVENIIKEYQDENNRK